MTNKEFQEQLAQYPDDAVIAIEYCNIATIRYNDSNNIIYID